MSLKQKSQVDHQGSNFNKKKRNSSAISDENTAKSAKQTNRELENLKKSRSESNSKNPKRKMPIMKTRKSTANEIKASTVNKKNLKAKEHPKKNSQNSSESDFEDEGTKEHNSVKTEKLKKPVKKKLDTNEKAPTVSKKVKLEKPIKVKKVEQKPIKKLEIKDKIVEKKENKIKDEDSSSSESEWEEVADADSQDIDEYQPVIPKEGVEITLDQPNVVRRREKKEFDLMAYIRLQINRVKKEAQLVLHQVHLLCLFARGIYINKILNCDELKALSLSLIPKEFFVKPAKFNEEFIKKLLDWFGKTFVLDSNYRPVSKVYESREMMSEFFQLQRTPYKSIYNLMFICIARTLGFKARMCRSLYPMSFKPKDLLKKEKPSKTKDDPSNTAEKASGASSSKTSTKNKDTKTVAKTKVKKPVKAKSSAKPVAKKKNHLDHSKTVPKKSLRKSLNKPSYAAEGEADDSDDDFVIEISSSESEDDRKVKKYQRPSTSKRKPKNRKILSSDSSMSDEQETPNNSGLKCWIEILLKSSEKWISMDCSSKIFDKPYKIESVAMQPVCYVLAFDNNSYVKDVTKRYCSQWMTKTRKLRVEPEWWEDAVEPFRPPNTKQDRNEESQMEATLLRKPIPTTIGELKNHPLYVLKRHLLKFQGIYPPDAPTVGFLRAEPIYARECVHTLHSRETWHKEARLVRIGEEPYKIVKARPKWDRVTSTFKTDLPLHLFGRWQTEDYMPPVAWNGKVPRNEYGNVELFKPCMLPVGTVHLRNPGIFRVAKKLDIDCVPAVVGFDGHCGNIHPVLDGFVVCEEFKDTLLEAWEEEQENIRKREEEKREKRVYGNWKKLIKGVLIRERIKTKYAVH